MLGLADALTPVTLKDAGWVVGDGAEVGVTVGVGERVAVDMCERVTVAVDDLVDVEVVSGPWVTPPFAPWPARITEAYPVEVMATMSRRTAMDRRMSERLPFLSLLTGWFPPLAGG